MSATVIFVNTASAVSFKGVNDPDEVEPRYVDGCSHLLSGEEGGRGGVKRRSRSRGVCVRGGLLICDVADDIVRLHVSVALSIQTRLNNHVLGKASTEDRYNNLNLHERYHLDAG